VPGECKKERREREGSNRRFSYQGGSPVEREREREREREINKEVLLSRRIS
jgi:hypothetical protein